MSSAYDFSQAEPATDFDLIPAKTQVPVILQIQAGDPGSPEGAFALTKTGIWQLCFEYTVTEGPFAKRKLWDRLTMGAPQGVVLTDGQKKAVAISGTIIRSILEAGRGFAPTDESPAAIQARKMNSLFELDNLEFWVEVGVEPAQGQYSAKNKIAKILPFKSGDQAAMQFAGGGKPAPAPRPAPPAAAPAPRRASWAAPQ